MYENEVGFIGLGIMGRPMAKNLLNAGVELMVSDLNKEAVADVVEAGAKKLLMQRLVNSVKNHYHGSKRCNFQNLSYLMKMVLHLRSKKERLCVT